MRKGNYVEKLANNIEKKLNMNSDDIKALSRPEFKRLLRNGYFTEKRYHGRQTEPTEKQMDVLELHYGRPIRITSQAIYNANKTFSYKNRKTGRRYYPEYVRKNVRGRIIDSRTGRFVSSKKQNKK
jgi:hypothetical protein